MDKPPLRDGHLAELQIPRRIGWLLTYVEEVLPRAFGN
jgi:hypothetical protein